MPYFQMEHHQPSQPHYNGSCTPRTEETLYRMYLFYHKNIYRFNFKNILYKYTWKPKLPIPLIHVHQNLTRI